jgi:hypothetical protein
MTSQPLSHHTTDARRLLTLAPGESPLYGLVLNFWLSIRALSCTGSPTQVVCISNGRQGDDTCQLDC